MCLNLTSQERKNLLKLEIEIYKSQRSSLWISKLSLVKEKDQFQTLCPDSVSMPTATPVHAHSSTTFEPYSTVIPSTSATSFSSSTGTRGMSVPLSSQLLSRQTRLSSLKPTAAISSSQIMSPSQSASIEVSSVISTSLASSVVFETTAHSTTIRNSEISSSPTNVVGCAPNAVLNGNFKSNDDGWFCDGAYETGSTRTSGVLLKSSEINAKCKQIICLDQNVLYKFEFSVELHQDVGASDYAEVRVQDVGEPRSVTDHAVFRDILKAGLYSKELMLRGTSSGVQLLLFVAKGSTLRITFKDFSLYPASYTSDTACPGNVDLNDKIKRVSICRLNLPCKNCNDPAGGFCQRGVCLCKPTHSGEGCFSRRESSVFFDDFSSGDGHWLKGCKQWGGWAVDVTDPSYSSSIDAFSFSRINGGVVPPNVQVSQWEGERKMTLKIESHGDYYNGYLLGLDEKACSLRSGDNARDFQRVGGAVVSKDYFASGRYEVKMKMQSFLGAVTTMWTFWYGEYYYDGTESERELYARHCRKYCISKQNTPCSCLTADGSTCIDMCPECTGSYPCKQNGFDSDGNLQTFKAYWVRNHEVDIELPTERTYSRDGKTKYGLSYTSGHSFSNARFNTWRGEIMGYEEMNNFMDIGLNSGDSDYHIFRFDWHSGGHSNVTGKFEEARVEFYIDNDLKTAIYNDRKEYYINGLLRTIRYQRLQSWASQEELGVGGTVVHVLYGAPPHPDVNGWPEICKQSLCVLDWDKWTSSETGPVIPTIAGKFWIAVWFPTAWGGYPGFGRTHTVVDWVKITPFLETNDEYVPESYPFAETCNNECPY